MERPSPHLSQSRHAHGGAHGTLAAIACFVVSTFTYMGYYQSIQVPIGITESIFLYLLMYALFIAAANILYIGSPGVDHEAEKDFEFTSVITAVILSILGTFLYLAAMFVAGTGGQ